MKVRDLPAKAGFGWLAGGFALYRQSPHVWIFMVGGWLGLSVLLAFIPVLGQVAGSVLQPVFFAGMFLGAARQQRGQGVVPPLLFAGFRLRNLGALIALGALELAILTTIVLLLVVPAFSGIEFKMGDAKAMEELSKALEGRSGWLYLALVAAMAVKGMFWFCGPLLAFHETMKLGHALRWGVYASLSNLGALVCWGLGFLAIAIVLSLPLVLLRLSLLLPFLIMLVMPLVILSNYAAYRAVFIEDEAPGRVE
jgi:hypothetical protein